jgi:hypothetical protein
MSQYTGVEKRNSLDSRTLLVPRNCREWQKETSDHSWSTLHVILGASKFNPHDWIARFFAFSNGGKT